jgi:hypothetical protein
MDCRNGLEEIIGGIDWRDDWRNRMKVWTERWIKGTERREKWEERIGGTGLRDRLVGWIGVPPDWRDRFEDGLEQWK